MVEDTGWRRERPAIDTGDFPDSEVEKVREIHAEACRRLEEGMFKTAVQLLEQALRSDPQYLGTRHDLGIAYFRLERWEEAQEAFEQALSLAPADADLLYKRGLCQLQGGATQDAVESLEEAVEEGGHLEARYQLGLIYARQGQRKLKLRKKAREQFEAILEKVDEGAVYPALDRVCFALGSLYDREEQKEAIRIYRRGLAINPLSALGHNSLGSLLMQEGQVLGALGEFKVAIQLDPNLRSAYTNLAQLFCHHVKPGDLPQEYEHIIEEFEERAPQVLAHLSLELVELAKQQVYEGIYTKGHQLKNLLGIAGSRMRGLQRRVAEEKWGGELNGIRAEHERLYDEWVGFLAAMKPESVRPSVVEPARLARRVAEVVRSQPWKSQLLVRVQEGVPRIEADERMLREAITNLCLNAMEVLEEAGGGEVALGVGFDEIRSGVFIEIEDDGPGIAEELLEHIFDPGFTTKEQGNGYGLSIARRIAHAHHGELRVKSRLGHGTVFRLDLPLNFEGDDSGEGLSPGYLEKNR